MKQRLVERAIDGDGVARGTKDVGRAEGRSVRVNVAESPLTWLAARGLVTPRQVDAGEQLRRDYERSALAPSITSRWGSERVDGGGDGVDATTAQLAAKRRFDAAIAAIGPGLSDVAWRVICAGEPMAEAERAQGWPARSGRVVLTLALDRLAAHYGMR